MYSDSGRMDYLSNAIMKINRVTQNQVVLDLVHRSDDYPTLKKAEEDIDASIGRDGDDFFRRVNLWVFAWIQAYRKAERKGFSVPVAKSFR